MLKSTARGAGPALGRLAYVAAFLVIDTAFLVLEGPIGTSTFHPAAAFAFTLLLWLGPFYASAVVAAYGLAAIWAPGLREFPLALAAEAVGIALAYAMGVWVLRSWFRFDLQLRRTGDVAWFVVAAIVVSLAGAVAVGAARVAAGLLRPSAYAGSAVRFWLHDAVGILSVSPLLQVLLIPWLRARKERSPSAASVRARMREGRRFSRHRLAVEIVAQAASIPLVLWAVFGHRSSVDFDLYYWALMPVIWIAMRWGLVGGAIAVSMTNFGILIAARSVRFGPPELAAIQVVTIAVCLTGLFLGTAVAARLRTETKLLRAKRRAEAASRAKTEFLAVVSHELRTPMNSILGYNQLVLDEVEGLINELQRESLLRVDKHAKRLLGLIDSILDLASLEAGEWVPASAPFRITDVFSEVVETLGSEAERKGLAIRWRIEERVPDDLFGDSRWLRLGLLSLVDNAVKFTDTGEVSILAEMEAERGERVCLRFSVRDTGIGIPDGKRHAILDRFSQVERASTRTRGGLGLGLSICSRIVEGMGGRLWLESAVGAGSTFRFTAWFRSLPGSSAPANRGSGAAPRTD